MEPNQQPITEQQRQGLIDLLRREKRKRVLDMEKDYLRRFDRAKMSFLHSLSGNGRGFGGFSKKAASLFGGGPEEGPVLDEEIEDALESFDAKKSNLSNHFDQAILDVLTAPTMEDARQVVEQYI